MRDVMRDRFNYKSIVIYLLAILVGYCFADISILKFRPSLLPEKLPLPRPYLARSNQGSSSGSYSDILRKNIFSSDGKIPDKTGGQNSEGNDTPVLSNLPLNLMGTIVHVNPARSVATIEMKTKNEILSLRVGEPLGDMAEITKIERLKVTFRTKSGNRLEYIEIKDDSKLTMGLASGSSKISEIDGSETDKTVNKSWLENQLKDLPALLQQAASMPVFDASGKILGYRIVRIQPGSVYEKFGVKQNDIIKSVNNEAIDGPQKAADLFNSLRTSNSISLQVDRDGRSEIVQ
jgi:general secretion pathway protein C